MGWDEYGNLSLLRRIILDRGRGGGGGKFHILSMM